MIIKIYTDGDKFYFKDKERNIYHNNYGPGFTSITGYKSYRQNDKLHNPYGYTVIYAGGDKEYWLNGKEYSYEKWLQKRTKYL